MSVFEKILLTMQLIAAITWIGSVYMGAFIDWPVAKKIFNNNKFPYIFIVGQGRRVFWSVYFGIFILMITQGLLIWYFPPDSNKKIFFLIVKLCCLTFMISSTIYGSMNSWKKLQLSTNEEAWKMYDIYILRAKITFICGLLGSISTLWYY